MAAGAVVSSRSSSRFASGVSVGDVQNCNKCAEVELHLKQVLEELNSTQLVIQMLKEESTHGQRGGYRSIEPRNLIPCNQQVAVKTQENKWVEVIPSRHGRTKQVKRYSGKQQVETENRYKVLENLQEQTEIADRQKLEKSRGVTNLSKMKQKNKGHKVILIGDSHARECAQKISNYLGNSYEVTGYVNPGTGLEVITHSAKKELDDLTQKDVVIVCGGANNISKNESVKGLRCVTQFVQHRRHLNMIIMNAPHRFDLEESSCVNREVKLFNRKLTQIMKRYNHTEVIDMGAEREHYTKHGLHMNRKGKEYMTRKIADNIKILFTKQKLPPIPLEWNENPGSSTLTAIEQDTEQDIIVPIEPSNIKWFDDKEIVSRKHQDQTKQDRPSFDGTTTEVAHNAKTDSEEEEEEEEDEEVEERVPLITIDKKQEVASKRVRKQPVTRGDDFLWEV